MSEEENRRPLFKRQPPINKTYTPPYTSLRASEEEKLRIRNPQVRTKALPEEALSTPKPKIQEQYANMAISNLDELSNQIFSAENQEELKLKATEKAQKEQFEKDAEKALKDWEKGEVNSLDAQIEAELKVQGITKKDLQNNAKLRQAVTDWKRQNTAKFKELLISTEKSTIAENKSKFESAQRQQREAFKKNIASYEKTAKADVQSQITAAQNQIKNEQTKIMQDVNWSGTWDELEKYAKEQQSIISTLVARGTVKLEDDRVTLVKPPTALSDSDISYLHKIGLNVPNLPKGPQAYLYELGQSRFESQLFSPSTMHAKVQSEMASSALGDFVTTLAGTYNTLLASWTPLPKVELRGPTSSTFKYYQDLSPAQQAALDIAGVGASALGGYVAALPIGLTVKGTTLAAGSIASKIGVTAPKAVSSIAAKISASPKLQLALTWAPIAGFEAADVYSQIELLLKPLSFRKSTYWLTSISAIRFCLRRGFFYSSKIRSRKSPKFASLPYFDW
jgi:hypothetical protein